MSMTESGNTTITATCAHCTKDVQLRPGGLHMVVYDTGTDGYYEFFCPLCSEHNERRMDFSVMQLLNKAGVRHTLINVPAEVIERAKTQGPSIRSEDLLDFHLDISKTDFLAPVAEKAA